MRLAAAGRKNVLPSRLLTRKGPVRPESFPRGTMTTDTNAPSRSPEVVALEGEIDLHESPQVTQKLNPLIARKLPRIHLDLSRVSYIDSSGLAAFVDAMQRIQAYGGEFALIAMRESVHKIFEISRLDQVFKIYPGGEGGHPSAA